MVATRADVGYGVMNCIIIAFYWFNFCCCYMCFIFQQVSVMYDGIMTVIMVTGDRILLS